jgi:hypothetical protein
MNAQWADRSDANDLGRWCLEQAGYGTPAYDRDRHRELMIETGHWTPREAPTPEAWQAFLGFIEEPS